MGATIKSRLQVGSVSPRAASRPCQRVHTRSRGQFFPQRKSHLLVSARFESSEEEKKRKEKKIHVSAQSKLALITLQLRKS